MTTLYEVTKQALGFTMRDFASLRDFEAAKAVLQDSIRSALVEEEKAAAWLAERKEHWRKEKEKIQATDPELSAALGWPGGIGDPVLDRKTLLQMVAALRLTSKQALEALEYRDGDGADQWKADVITALRDALAQEQTEPDISRCPQCNGPADNGFDRSFPPSPYLCTKCMAEPVQPGAWVASKDGRVIYDYVSTDDCLLRVSGDFENDEQRFHYAKQIVDKLNAAPPQRTLVPLTDEEILAAVGWERAAMYMNLMPSFPVDEAKKETLTNARAIEKASWEKNHG